MYDWTSESGSAVTGSLNQMKRITLHEEAGTDKESHTRKLLNQILRNMNRNRVQCKSNQPNIF